MGTLARWKMTSVLSGETLPRRKESLRFASEPVTASRPLGSRVPSRIAPVNA